MACIMGGMIRDGYLTHTTQCGECEGTKKRNKISAWPKDISRCNSPPCISRTTPFMVALSVELSYVHPLRIISPITNFPWIV